MSLAKQHAAFWRNLPLPTLEALPHKLAKHTVLQAMADHGLRTDDPLFRAPGWSPSGAAVATLSGHTDEIYGVLALPDGRFLSWSWDNTLRLWSAEGAQAAVLEGHTRSVNGALALPDGRFLSWSNDRTLRLWSPEGAEVAVLEGHTRIVRGALALPDGRFLSWSEDGTLRLWSAEGALAAYLCPTGPLSSLIRSTDGRYFGTSGRHVVFVDSTLLEGRSP